MSRRSNPRNRKFSPFVDRNAGQLLLGDLEAQMIKNLLEPLENLKTVSVQEMLNDSEYGICSHFEGNVGTFYFYKSGDLNNGWKILGCIYMIFTSESTFIQISGLPNLEYLIYDVTSAILDGRNDENFKSNNAYLKHITHNPMLKSRAKLISRTLMDNHLKRYKKILNAQVFADEIKWQGSAMLKNKTYES